MGGSDDQERFVRLFQRDVTYADIHPDLHANVNPDIHANIDANVNPDIHANVNPDLHANVNANVNPDVHANVNTHLHADVHANVNTHIHPNAQPDWKRQCFDSDPDAYCNSNRWRSWHQHDRNSDPNRDT